MFVTENVRVLFKRANLKLVQEAGELHRVAEATFVLEPLPPELAHELGEDIAGHLFDENEQIRAELDVIDRALVMWSNPGDVVLSPFMGIGSEGVQSMKAGRRFIGTELKESYFRSACQYLDAADRQSSLLESA